MPEDTRETLYLVDGYALIYRAFFALIARPLQTKSGENTSAAWGVTNFLFRLLERYRPTYLAWVHDRGVSHRERTYPAYKATRQKLADEQQQDFDLSLERIRALLEGFRVPIVALDGYEADDVIGTLARQASARGLRTVIVSGDKDFYQLIGPDIALLNPGRGGQAAIEEHWVDERNARERLGVPPHRVVDYLALVGDSSDNVPGVKGVGDKTAVELLERFGDLDAIIAHADEITGKRAREALKEQSDLARLSRELVTIRCDVPIELDLERLRLGTPDAARLARLFTELEFRTLLDKLDRAPAAQPTTRPVRVEVLNDPARVGAMVTKWRAAPFVALDVRSPSFLARSANVVALAVALGPEQAWYLPFAHRSPEGELGALARADEQGPINLPPLADESMRPLREWLEDDRASKLGHNVKTLGLALRAAGVRLGGVARDTALASFVLDPGRRSHALEELAREMLGLELPAYGDLTGKGRSERPYAEVAVEDAAAYAGSAAAAVLALHARLEQELVDHGLLRLLETVELPLIPVLLDMEWHGVLVDRERLGEIGRQIGAELGRLEQEIYRAAGTQFNINSTPQLRAVLFDRLQLPVVKRTKTGASTDVDVLEQLAASGHEVPQLIIAYRELSKLKSTYVDALPGYINPRTGRIHTSFNQTGASTGRLSSSDPNLQNIPVRTERSGAVRRAFVAPAGAVLLVADYSQIELRLLAHLSEDQAFVQAFVKGGDIHRQTAALIFNVPEDAVTAEMRARAKTINFATIYGQGAFALSRQLGITLDEAKAFIRQYFERFAGVRAWLDRTIQEARERGYVETLFGRRRYLPEIRDRNFNIRAFAERTATNSPLQGSAADLIKLAMISIHGALERERVDGHMVLQVHDELVLEVSDPSLEPAKTIVKREMESAAELRVPLVVSLGAGRNWLEAKY
jgi:DNA polymerase-1